VNGHWIQSLNRHCRLALALTVIVSLGCVSSPASDEKYIDPTTSWIDPFRVKGDGSNVTGVDKRAREIERSLGG
jgi:hypothetical protein